MTNQSENMPKMLFGRPVVVVEDSTDQTFDNPPIVLGSIDSYKARHRIEVPEPVGREGDRLIFKLPPDHPAWPYIFHAYSQGESLDIRVPESIREALGEIANARFIVEKAN